ncbi:CATRA system-associated protein [Actinoplanes sp. NPDC023714]|uniref:CATRA system-associated protein n=1 Tax=Actinoplanes sp. NPDC023714 TaxID=3154322 RepID=UPI0033D5109E
MTTPGDALPLLDAVVTWTLPPEDWAVVAEILEDLEIAHRGQDAAAWQAAMADLGPHGPRRATRIGSAMPTGIPAPVLERRNVLVHALGGAARGERPDRRPVKGQSA